MDYVSLPALVDGQIQKISKTAEETVGNHVLSRVPQRRISVLDVTSETKEFSSTIVSLGIRMIFSPSLRGYNQRNLLTKRLCKRSKH